MRQAVSRRAEEAFRCVICGLPLVSRFGLSAHDAPCRDCGCVPWCRKRVVDGRVLLSVLPDRTPEDTDIQRLADSLVGSDEVEMVVVDLSQLNTVNSLFLARLLALNKRLQPFKGTLAICGMSPIIREIFRRTHFDTLLDVLESESGDGATRDAGDGPTRAIACSIG